MKNRHATTPYDLSAQIVAHARTFLGCPYLTDGLIGSHDTKEEFVTRRDAFDCVTLVETVLAECFSEAYDTSFKDELRELRYRNGEISWLSRLHYFSDWLETNEAHGRVRAVFPGLSETRRTLSLLSHFDRTRAKLPIRTPGSLYERFGGGEIPDLEVVFDHHGQTPADCEGVCVHVVVHPNMWVKFQNCLQHLTMSSAGESPGTIGRDDVVGSEAGWGYVVQRNLVAVVKCSYIYATSK